MSQAEKAKLKVAPKKIKVYQGFSSDLRIFPLAELRADPRRAASRSCSVFYFFMPLSCRKQGILTRISGIIMPEICAFWLIPGLFDIECLVSLQSLYSCEFTSWSE